MSESCAPTDSSVQPVNVVSVGELARTANKAPSTVREWASKGLVRTTRDERGATTILVESLPQELRDELVRARKCASLGLEALPKGADPTSAIAEGRRRVELFLQLLTLSPAERGGQKGGGLVDAIAAVPDRSLAERYPSLTKRLHLRSALRTAKRIGTAIAEGKSATIMALGNLRARPRAEAPRLPADAVALIHRLWLKDHAASKAQVHRVFIAEARKRGWPTVSRRTVVNIVNRIDAQAQALARHGERKYEANFGPHVVRDLSSFAVGELLVGDHHQLDVMTRKRAGKLVRLWLTVWFCPRSNLPFGWIVSEQPSAVTIKEALAHAMLPKVGSGFAQRFWQRVCGKPDLLHDDNGRDFQSQRFEALYRELGVQPLTALPYNAKAKQVERFFGTVARDFSSRFFWNGYCGSSPETKPHCLAELVRKHEAFTRGEAATSPFMTADELRERFEAWIVEYAERAQDELGERGQKLSPARAVMLFGREPRIPTADAVRYLLMESTEKTVRRNGVKLDGGWYRSTELLTLVGQRVEVRRDPSDASLAHIFRGSELVCRATAVEAVGRSIDQLRDQMKLLREHKRHVKQALETLTAAAPADAPHLSASLDRPATAKQVNPDAPRPLDAITELVPKYDSAAHKVIDSPVAASAPAMPDASDHRASRLDTNRLYGSAVEEFGALRDSGELDDTVSFEGWRRQRTAFQAEFQRLQGAGELDRSVKFRTWERAQRRKQRKHGGERVEDLRAPSPSAELVRDVAARVRGDQR